MIGIGLHIANRVMGSQLPFRFTVNTNNTSAGSSTSTQFKLPLVSSGTLNAVVDWGDGTSSTITTWNQAEVTHTYATAGVYDIKITGVLTGWLFSNSGDRLKILNIISWGIYTETGYSGFDGAFWGCSNMTSSATDKPLLLQGTLWNFFRGCSAFNGNIGNWNMSQVSQTRNFFNGCTNFNQNISEWDVSNVSNMESMFESATAFNQNIGSWNVSNVTTFSSMFNGARAFNNGGSADINNWTIRTASAVSMSSMFRSCTFNQNISSWNTSAVTNMSAMFSLNGAFNQPIGSWNTSAVTDMNNMFSTSNFNQNIGAWNVSNVTSFGNMFGANYSFNNGGSSDINNWTIKNTGTVSMVGMFGDSTFNQPIGNWNTSAVTNMSLMFRFNTTFNQAIGNWNVSNVTNFSSFMEGKSAANYSAANLNAIYNGWSSRSVQPNLSISFGTIKYTAEAQAGKNILDFAPNNWTIVDGGI
jgi:surface protein